ncbi:hypothetical protein [Haliscomenobacter sp.]|uniref:hypothetical protein n=1 Tax=Haliscomenobacter sp. TaxID=2717303 RepID=UPI0035937EEE
MKNLLIAFLLVMGTFALSCSLQAQDLKKYSPLFQALNKGEKVQLLATLKDLTSSAQVGDQLQRDLFADLKKGLPVANPTAGIDSLLNAWSAGRSELTIFLQKNPAEFDAKAIEAILGAYDQANVGWIQNLSQIQNGFSQYRDSMQVDPALVAEAEIKYEESSTQMHSALNRQYQDFANELLLVSNSQNRSWDKIVNNLLNDFGALEIGAGFQSLLATYYDEAPDSTTAILLRFGSAPNYNQLWGAEWNAWVSFKGGQENAEQPTTAGFKSYLAGGSVSFQFRPEVPFTQGVMRLITGVGANVGAYMPARINSAKTASFNNKGKTTGFGPEVRLGFAVNTGKLGFYAYSNRSIGYVLRCPDYPFNSWQVVSGIQWEALHLRFAHGDIDWAKDNNRHATYNELSMSVRIK